jgi:peptide deformylase
MNKENNRVFEPKPIKLLGDPVLRQVSKIINDFSSLEFNDNVGFLHATLTDFRRQHGFGRGISAPQIGVNQRFIALNLDTMPRLIVNPDITWRSHDKFTMWDDCMSFPNLLVRLERHKSISLSFQDVEGNYQTLTNLDIATSELLQHEIDHLDGILAIDRAIDKNSVILREYFVKNREEIDQLIDYTIY